MHALELLTLNLHGGFDLLGRRFVLPRLREAMRAAGPDLVFLQEVLGAHAGHAARHAQWPAEAQPAFLGESVWTRHAYGRNFDFAQGHLGNAVLSRLPMVQRQNRDVSQPRREPRGLLHCVVDLPAGPSPDRQLHAVCVHLGLRDAERARQLQMLAALIDEIPPDAPLVVAGDFNDWRQRAHATLADVGLHEAFRQAHGRAAATYPAPFPVLALDRIYLRNAQATATRRLPAHPWSRLSDHRPLMARIEF